jgi:biopolymer transport protein ExbD
MAGGMDLSAGGKGGKRPLDTPINLVPFIDLMAVTISFLIMTAVWNQISRLSVTQAGGKTEEVSPPRSDVPLVLVVGERGFTLNVGGASPVDIPKNIHGEYVLCHSGRDRVDDGCEARSLIWELRRIKADLPQQRLITVEVEDGIRYGDLVRVIDACNQKDSANQPTLFPEVAVSAIG